MTDTTPDLTVWSVNDYDDEIFHGAFLDRDHAMESAEAVVRNTYRDDGADCEFRWTDEGGGVFELEARTSADDTWYDTCLRVATLTVNGNAVGPDDKPLPEDGSAERRFRFREDRLGAIVKDHAEMITAGREGNQLITWMGDVDQTHVRHSWVYGKQIGIDFLMTGLDTYKSPETCPRISVVLDRAKAQALIGKITDTLREQAHKAGEDCGVRACGPCSFDRVKRYDEQQRAAGGGAS